MIDVIMATYNGEKYIREQLDSILNQTYGDIRIIVRDDGSKDGTVDIVREYAAKYPGTVTLVEDDAKCGSSRSNFMQAMKYATADYIMFSDQDDFWLPDKIQGTFDRMLQIEGEIGKDKPVLVFGSYRPVDEALNDIGGNAAGRQEAAYKLAFTNLLVQNYVNGCLMMVNRALAERMGDFDDRILMHDWWAALIAAGSGRVEHIDKVQMLYRQHGDNVVGSVNVKSFRYRLRKLMDPSTREASKCYLAQAQLLYERCGKAFPEPHRTELERFIALYQKNKLGRAAGLVRGNYLKSDLVRVLGQLWYI